ncbi:UvrD-helicase domain-containing protein [Sphaerimonospora sp. CA-214678]|uniref:UvrD-helicase domain-containing protein n=1 Tax=Sphaerimonospora sp. CA-214678 TaxID=3240029 RepID=UPI003D8AAF9A
MADRDVAEQVISALDERRSFLVDAGAGSGKTHTLVQALRHLLTERRADLERTGGRVACITYTNVAKDEIRERVGADPLVLVATIHEFLWAEIERFQDPLREALIARNDESDDPQDLESLTSNVPIRYVQLGRNLAEGRISHDDVLALSHRLVSGSPKLARIIADRFPYILVDEYQDTSPLTVEVLLDHLAGAGSRGCTVGLFGDSMQKIYRTGVGEVKGYPDLLRITKDENRRSAQSIIDVLNAVRPDLVQKPIGLPRSGEVRLFLQRDVPKEARLSSALGRLDGLGWPRESSKQLFLTHRAIARDLDYPDLLDAYRKANRLDSLHDGTDPFACHMLDIEALCTAFDSEDPTLLAGLLATKKIKITKHEDKGRISRALQSMVASRATMTVGAVFDQAQELGLLNKSAEIKARERSIMAKDLDSRAQRRVDLARTVLALPYVQAIAYGLYMNGQTPLATQHGVKGAEFDDVVVVIDDKAWTMYSMNEMLADPFGTKDRIHRTRSLFYVSCSRARNRLAVVFLSDLSPAAEHTARTWFAGGTVHP